MLYESIALPAELRRPGWGGEMITEYVVAARLHFFSSRFSFSTRIHRADLHRSHLMDSMSQFGRGTSDD